MCDWGSKLRGILNIILAMGSIKTYKHKYANWLLCRLQDIFRETRGNITVITNDNHLRLNSEGEMLIFSTVLLVMSSIFGHRCSVLILYL